ncbi:hypothetical protein PoB_002812100 [Plakobranchus ocellatus]|uniref:Uncharacterized protein n=1 Tax=Plakobranchus ocellatus TaxID=259542 RepID=A0AAV3ZRD0_9GAST|nr:hypothetical protein PoB_002812100 [Plakobranchus ocellatus]
MLGIGQCPPLGMGFHIEPYLLTAGLSHTENSGKYIESIPPMSHGISRHQALALTSDKRVAPICPKSTATLLCHTETFTDLGILTDGYNFYYT